MRGSLASMEVAKYLFFAASTDSGPSSFGLGGSEAHDRPVTRSVYPWSCCARILPSSLAPESDEEKIARRKKKEDKPDKPATIDLDNIGQRILPLPMPARNYRTLAPGKEGVLFFSDAFHLSPAD